MNHLRNSTSIYNIKYRNNNNNNISTSIKTNPITLVDNDSNKYKQHHQDSTSQINTSHIKNRHSDVSSNNNDYTVLYRKTLYHKKTTSSGDNDTKYCSNTSLPAYKERNLSANTSNSNLFNNQIKVQMRYSTSTHNPNNGTSNMIVHSVSTPTFLKRNNSNSITCSSSSVSKIKLEDFLLLKERFDDLHRRINTVSTPSDNDNGISQACFEWLIFYFASSLVDKYKTFFSSSLSSSMSNANPSLIILSANNLELFSIMLIYNISNNPLLLHTFNIILKSVLVLLRDNFLLILSHYLTLIKPPIESSANELYTLLKQRFLSNVFLSKSEREIVSIIKDNCSNIVAYIKIILNQYKTLNMQDYNNFAFIFNNISKMSNVDISKFFFDKVVTPINMNRSLLNNVNIKKKYFKTVDPPYLKYPLEKKYTLVLDLDETLFCFKFKSNDENSGTLFLRPGLFSFLKKLKVYYELVSFTSATKEYAEPILSNIESKEKYFDYKLYREHAVLIGKDFVKDISRIGREIIKDCYCTWR